MITRRRHRRQPGLDGRVAARPPAGRSRGRRRGSRGPAYIVSVSRFPNAKLRRRNRSSRSIGCERARLVDEERGEGGERRRSASPRSPGCSSRRPAARSARTSTPGEAERAERRRRGSRRGAALGAPRPRTALRASSSVTSTIGTLIAKIQRHEAWSTITPPASGPMIIAIPLQAVHEPIALPRTFAGNAATMIASELGVSSAPAAPCSARAAISVPLRRRDRAEQRQHAERGDPEHEHAPLAVDVAERAARRGSATRA